VGERENHSLTSEEMDRIRREAMAFAGIGLYRYQFDGTILFMDRGAMKILDLESRFGDESELTGRKVEELITYMGPRGYLRQAVREHGHVRNFEYYFQTVTGIERWALHDSYLVQDVQTGQEAVQVIIQDITDRKLAERAVANERERLVVTLRSIGDGVITTDVDGKIVLVNRVAEELTGWSQAEAVGRPLQEVFRIINEKTRDVAESPVERVLREGLIVGLANHTALIARDGRERVIADSAAPIRDTQSKVIGVVLVFRDVTEKYRLEEELQRIERLESVGVLAGGIAHDFNNLLSSILGNLSLAQVYLPPSARIRDLLEQSEKATLRAKDLTFQLLTFARGGKPVKRTVTLEGLVRESVGFALSGSDVRCVFDIPPDLWPVDVDAGQLGQVIHNLILNADQAMPDGGQILVSCDNLVLFGGGSIPLPPGRYVRLVVADKGVGIPESVIARIFDPYFTTKQKGSGLGLTIVHSIVKGHDGHIGVESRVGEGSRFTIHLPASQGEAAAEAPPMLAPLSGSGRVLVMDDEGPIREMAGQMLAHLGYEPSFAADGAEAIERYREGIREGKPYEVVILDLTIPGGMGGAETVRRLHAIDPNVCAVASSGYSSDPIMAEHRQYGFSGALAKPYTIVEFSRMLARVAGTGPAQKS